jgi:hypothetical protein
MPHHVFTRQALYECVWAEPKRTVAQRLGVSDVGLAKACRAAGIPTPPRGWWAKLQHGKPLSPKPPLPARPDHPDRVVIAPSPPKPPPSPAFAGLATEITEAAPIPVPDDLRGAHAIVRRWVAENAERRRDHRRNGWGLSLVDDLTTPLAQRRLRLTSALLKALERRKLTVSHGRDGLTATRGDETVTFTVYERSKVEHRPATADELRWRPERTTVRATVAAGDLVVKIRDYLSVPTEFREQKTPLEKQLPAVVASVEAGLVELAERRLQRALEKERWEAADRARRKRVAYGEAQGALRDRLVAQAGRRQQAEAIRAYVLAADGSPAAQAEDYAGWRVWALAEADALDPLLEGSAPFDRLPPLEDWSWRGW